jgi:glutamine amidotransferase
MIVIVNYGLGNLESIKNMLKKVGFESVISSNPEEIRKASKLILPGVGAFDNGMKNLHDLRIIPVLEEKVFEKRTPILGICLGMQLFTKKSEEGIMAGLGWINAETVRFQFQKEKETLKIPHMGWNTIKCKKESTLFQDPFPEMRFYFVHSYHAVCQKGDDILTETHYGYDFTSSFQKENIIGVQFHPEKSHKFGMKLLRNFVEFC